MDMQFGAQSQVAHLGGNTMRAQQRHLDDGSVFTKYVRWSGSNAWGIAGKDNYQGLRSILRSCLVHPLAPLSTRLLVKR